MGANVSYKQIAMATTVLVTSLCFATKMHEGIALGRTQSEELGGKGVIVIRKLGPPPYILVGYWNQIGTNMLIELLF